MKIKAVEDLPVRNRKAVRGHYSIAQDLERTVEKMRLDIWYKVIDCPYNNANDYYRMICNASRQLNYPVYVKMRDGSIYLRRTK